MVKRVCPPREMTLGIFVGEGAVRPSKFDHQRLTINTAVGEGAVRWQARGRYYLRYDDGQTSLNRIYLGSASI
jgi:hypothetical protein